LRRELWTAIQFWFTMTVLNFSFLCPSTDVAVIPSRHVGLILDFNFMNSYDGSPYVV
jgi:hypothetical protein